MRSVVFFTRAGCHLCEDARVWLDELCAESAFDVTEIDIDAQPELGKQYLEKIPVIQVDGFTLVYPFSKEELRLAILTSFKIASKSSKSYFPVTSWLKWLDSHWLVFINAFFGLFLAGSFVPPILEKVGFTQAAKYFYTFYGFFCHQLAFRSIFLFGDQWAYPRSLAGVGDLRSFGSATGINEADIFASRDYVGDTMLGFKVALCERDLGMYIGLLAFGLFFTLFRKKFSGLPLWAWLVFGLIPIGIDGGTQLLSQLPIPLIKSILPPRESTPLIRTITGFIFGFGTAWLTFPVIHAGMRLRK